MLTPSPLLQDIRREAEASAKFKGNNSVSVNETAEEKLALLNLLDTLAKALGPLANPHLGLPLNSERQRGRIALDKYRGFQG